MATLAVTVCADGMKVSKGKQISRIAAKECPMFSTGCEYFCQENAWMDENAMLECV